MIRLTWEGGSHDFAFCIGELRALQDETNAGPGQVLQRLGNGDWRVDDLLSTLALGLKGGGMEEQAARSLALRVFKEGNLLGLALTASAALSHRLLGNPDAPKDEGDDQGKDHGESPADGISASSTAGAE